MQRVLRRAREGTGHLRRTQAPSVATGRRNECVRRRVSQRRGARGDASHLRWRRLPRPGLPRAQAGRPHRADADHRAQRGPTDRTLCHRGAGWRRAGLHRLLRRRRAADPPDPPALRRRQVDRRTPRPPGGSRRVPTRAPVRARLGQLPARAEGARDLVYPRPAAVRGRPGACHSRRTAPAPHPPAERSSAADSPSSRTGLRR